MQINLISAIFIFAFTFTGIVGLLLNYVEQYLPTIISRSYRYGKFSAKEYQSLVAKAEVPKRWFKHFYLFSAPISSCVLCLIIFKYLWNIDIPRNLIWILNISFGQSREPLVPAENTFIATFLFTMHCWKRLYETQCVSIYSDKMINISHYMIGFYHYMGCLICIIGESEGFVEGSNADFSWKNITFLQLVCAFILILSSYSQLKANLILRNLRINKDGGINSAVYKIPHGGLFEYVSGALQITEITVYIALSIILWKSSTFHYITIWVMVNQTATAVMTHKWYVQTFPNYPKSRKILIPYLF